MDSYLAAVKTRVFGRVATLCLAFFFAVAFVYTAMSLTPTGNATPEVVKIPTSHSTTGSSSSTSSNAPQNAHTGLEGSLGGGAAQVVIKNSVQTCGAEGTKGDRKIIDAAERKYAALRDDKFTIAMLTYQRPKELNDTLHVLLSTRIPSLHEVVVVWNDLTTTPPPGYVSDYGVNVRYRQTPVNSLNQKLIPDPKYETKAILLSDDDVYYHPSDLEFVFQTWRAFGHNRLTGALARCGTLDGKSAQKKWKYGFCSSKNEEEDLYNLIITNLSFAHISFLDYYSSDDPAMVAIRAYVDAHLNCEDIAMNLVASMLSCQGPLQVKGRKPYFSAEPPGGISHKPGHIENRGKCLGEFERILGFMPLVNQTAHVERGVFVSNIGDYKPSK